MSTVRSDHDTTVLVVTDRALWPRHSGNRVGIVGLLKTLKAAGCRTVLIAANRSRIGALATIVDRLYLVDVAPFRGGDPAEFDWSPFVDTLRKALAGERVVAVIVEYLWLAPLLSCCHAGVTKAIDSHQVFHESYVSLTSLGLDPWVCCDMRTELALLQCADVVLTRQQRETDLLTRLLPSTRVSYVPPLIELEGGHAGSVSFQRVLTIGSGHAGNAGLIEFAESVWPQVTMNHPAAHLHVVGRIGEAIRPSRSVTVDLEVRRIREAYTQAMVVACPVRVGAGLKIKMAEALRYGKAVAATAVAADGLPKPDAPCWLEAPTVEALNEPVSRLLADPELRILLERRARSYGEKEFGLASCVRHVSEALGF